MHFRLFLPVLTGVMLLAACRGNAPDDTADRHSPAAETPARTGDSSVLALVESQPSLSTLHELIQRVELDSTLTDGGPYTLFAPTDDAFSDLDESASSLTNAELRRLVKYHMLPTRMRTQDVPGAMTIQMMSGEEVSLQPDESGLSIGDGAGNRARVVTPDLEAPNGVVHVVDRVLQTQ